MQRRIIDLSSEIERNRESLVRKMLPKIRHTTKLLQDKILKAYKDSPYFSGSEIHNALIEFAQALELLLADDMMASHLYGRLRTLRRYAIQRPKRLSVRHFAATSPYEDVLAFLQKRLDIDDRRMADIRRRYGEVAADVTKGINGTVEARAKKAIEHIITEGMHVKEGVEYLGKELRAEMGSDINPWLLETIVRTQTQIAYGAGQWNMNQDQAIQEDLWGYEYVTVGDDRVRPEHAAMDGARYPKDHPFWQENWPPNGYNCRCAAIEIFNDEVDRAELQEAPAGAGADEDWRINFGQIFTF